MFKEIIAIGLIILVLGCTTPKEEVTPKVVLEYFSSPTCESCKAVEANVSKTFEEYKDILNVVRYEAPNPPDLNSEFGKKVKEYNIQVTPSYVINGVVYSGSASIRDMGKHIRMAYSIEDWKLSRKDYYIEYFYMGGCANCEKVKDTIEKLGSNPNVHLVRYDLDTKYGGDHIEDYGLQQIAPVLVFNVGADGTAIGSFEIPSHEIVKKLLR
ncbi:MAG: Thioredoxin [Candidatus Methanofastidiosum methylothiophilum]|uniref:Thioredoxin n=1 Tax=Candidatus Methanofastidiosum methylothiophilum TaxID=1705564 RepID=A0A150IPY6_9EURY|nr:MAG: Thioredoxin [Candidatus Methanofastidiosum methylthiophilus]